MAAESCHRILPLQDKKPSIQLFHFPRAFSGRTDPKKAIICGVRGMLVKQGWHSICNHVSEMASDPDTTGQNRPEHPVVRARITP